MNDVIHLVPLCQKVLRTACGRLLNRRSHTTTDTLSPTCSTCMRQVRSGFAWFEGYHFRGKGPKFLQVEGQQS